MVDPAVMLWIKFGVSIVFAAAVGAANLPPATETSSAFYKGFRKVMDWVGQNYKNAKNAE